MPIKIPNLGPSSSGPALPGVSVNDAIKPALALSNVGRSIGNAGDKMYEHDMKIMEAENAADLTEFKNQAKTAYANRQASFEDNPNHLTFKDEWNKDLDGLNKTLSESGYSNSTTEKAKLFMSGFESDSRIGVASSAQARSVQRRDQMVRNGVAQLEQFYDPSNAAVSRSMLDDIKRDNPEITPEGWEALEMRYEEFTKKADSLHAANTEPRAWLEANREPGSDLALWEVTRRAATRRLADLVNEDQSRVLNALANGSVNVEGVEALTPNMDDAQRAKLVEFVEDAHNANYQKVLRSPENQARLTGSLTAQIHTFDPVEDRGTEKELSILRNLDGVVDPHIKERLTQSYKDSINELESTKKGNFETGLDQINVHFSQIESRVTKPPMEVENRSVLSHLQDGFFNDPEKLKALGLSDDQIDEVRKRGTVDAQAGYLKEIWEERPKQVYASPDAVALAEATVKKGGSLGAIFSSKDKLNVEASEAYHRKLNSLNEEKGRMVESYSRWAAQNPAATYDDHLNKSREIAQESREQQARSATIPSSASSQSASAWRTNLKLSNYGYASDTTPDSYSRKSIGHASNMLRDGQSAAISKSLAKKLGLKRGAVLEIQTTQGKRVVTYDDTVPPGDKRTGPLPETIDIFRKSEGSNEWGGRVQGVKLILQGRDGISGRAYTQFSTQNYQKALSLIQE